MSYHSYRKCIFSMRKVSQSVVESSNGSTVGFNWYHSSWVYVLSLCAKSRIFVHYSLFTCSRVTSNFSNLVWFSNLGGDFSTEHSWKSQSDIKLVLKELSGISVARNTTASFDNNVLNTNTSDNNWCKWSSVEATTITTTVSELSDTTI